MKKDKKLDPKYTTVKCLDCGKILISTHVHDYKVCGCPNNTMADGGTCYARYGGVDMSKIEILTKKGKFTNAIFGDTPTNTVALWFWNNKLKRYRIKTKKDRDAYFKSEEDLRKSKPYIRGKDEERERVYFLLNEYKDNISKIKRPVDVILDDIITDVETNRKAGDNKW